MRAIRGYSRRPRSLSGLDLCRYAEPSCVTCRKPPAPRRLTLLTHPFIWSSQESTSTSTQFANASSGFVRWRSCEARRDAHFCQRFATRSPKPAPGSIPNSWRHRANLNPASGRDSISVEHCARRVFATTVRRDGRRDPRLPQREGADNWAQAMRLETKFLRLSTPVAIGSRFGEWRVCWLGGWTRNRLSFMVMVIRTSEIDPGSHMTIP